MPFGAHKGKALANVPASYLMWLSGQFWFKNEALLKYILDNMTGLIAEAKKEKYRSR